MKLSIFTTATDPEKRGDNYKDALECFAEVADEVVLINGGQRIETATMARQSWGGRYEWPKEFDWSFIGEQFTRGYEVCTGDWAIHCDLDMIFHQKDFGKIRQALRDYPTAPAVSFYKHQFILPDRYNLKSRLILAVNKAQYGDRIKFDSGGDLCQPSLDGKEIDLASTPQAGVPFYNYEHLLKTKEQITDDVERMDRAYFRRFGHSLYSRDNRSAYDGWYEMMAGRFLRPSEEIPLEAHPKYVQETIKNLKPENFGYNGFGLIEGRVYA